MSDTLTVIEPATEAVLEEIARADADAVDEAVARAKQASPAWTVLSPGERAAIMRSVIFCSPMPKAVCTLATTQSSCASSSSS